MRRSTAVWVVAVCLGCGTKAKEGLPPAESWDQFKAAGTMAPLDQSQRPRTGGARPADPHAGVPGAPPLSPSEDPHAGVAMGGDPHAGMGGGVDVTQLGLAAPDPNRKIDPSRRLQGTLKLSPKVAGRVKPTGAIFLVVKRAGADGKPTGTPLAVEKLTWAAGDALPFELSEANAMAAGTELVGDVVITARYDQDSDAISKQTGDVTGEIRAKVPAAKLVLTLDTVLP
jgi:hypothetical protein